MMEALRGDAAPAARRDAIDLITTTSASVGAEEVADLRQAMCIGGADPGGRLGPTVELWRYLQVRQLFRLALEGAFDWMRQRLADGTRTTAWLVDEFLRHVPDRLQHPSAAQWFALRSDEPVQAPNLLVRLERAVATRSSEAIVPAVSDALSFCLTACSLDPARDEREDRLSLAKAHREFAARGDGTPADMVRHVLESWVVAQHVYWSVGRGLADARVGGKRILRLKVVVGELG
jgi:hypothetical protein